MIPKSTENTITTLLKKELEKRGVSCEAFKSLQTPAGRREPDLYCRNGGVYVIEAKFSESDLWKAVAKVQNDYLKYHKTLIIRGGFAVLYPKELTRPLHEQQILQLAAKLQFKVVMVFLPEDTRRNLHVFEGTLNEIAAELARQILTPPDTVEASVDYIIRILRDVAHAITAGLRHLTGSQLEDLFGGKHVFENILHYAEGKYPEEDFRIASAYLLVNQLLFYQVLFRRKPDTFEEIDIDKLRAPAELYIYFSKVMELNYRTVFSYDVASRIPPTFLEEVKGMIGAIQSLSAEKVGGDLLGTIFHDLIPFDVRKKVAAFYTNIFAADLLACLTISDKDATVADFACGSGGLLVAAYRRKRQLLKRKREFTAEDHRRFVEEALLGVDVMPFAANVAACHLALQAPEYFTNKVRVAIWDSSELAPGRAIPSIAHQQFVLSGQHTLLPWSLDQAEEIPSKGRVQLGDELQEEIHLEPQQVVIMNPPFTRQIRMPRKYKLELYERFKHYASYLHGQMAYYGYFILLADRFLKTGGRMGLVLPAAFLRTRSLEMVRRLLSEHYHIEYVVTGLGQLNFSETTWRREILLVARKLEENESKGDTFFIEIAAIPSSRSETIRLSRRIRRLGHRLIEEGDISAKRVNARDLEEDLDWFRFFTSFGEEGISELWEVVSSGVEGLTKFEEVYDLQETVKRGIETSRGMKVQAVFIPSSERRAIRKEDVWILSRRRRNSLQVCNRFAKDVVLEIPKECVLPALRTTAGNSTMSLERMTDFVVIRDFPGAEKFFFGERGTLRPKLPRWEEYVKARMGNLIIQRRFPINAPGTHHLCYFSAKPVAGSGTTWVAKLPPDDAKILCLWFNSSLHVGQVFVERIEDVWLDVHKYILEEMLVLNPHKLVEGQRKMLLECFDVLAQKAFPSLEKQFLEKFEWRRKLDLVVLKALGMDSKEAEQLQSQLCDRIMQQFLALRKISR